MYFRSLIIFMSLFSLSTSALADDHKRQMHAHEHGVSTLKIAVEGLVVHMELESPGNDIVGFEHVAKDNAEKDAVAKAIKTLKQPLEVFILSDKAGCTVDSMDVEYHTEGEHAEFHSVWKLKCSELSALKSIETKFFKLFPAAEEIEIEAISEKGQTAIEFEKGMTTIDLSAIF